LRLKIGFADIDAKAKTVDTTRALRNAFARRRRLAPVEAFYEWKRLGPKKKQPSVIALADAGLTAMAGLGEDRKSPAGEWVRSFTIVTCPTNELCSQIHDRMPVVLPRARRAAPP